MTRRPILAMTVLMLCAHPAQGGSLDAIDIRSLLLKRDPFEVLRKSPAAVPPPERPAAGSPGQSRQEPDSPNLRLRAVIYDQTKSLVNIGGMILEVGEFIDGYRVMSISERYVVLSGKGQQIRLSVDGTPLR